VTNIVLYKSDKVEQYPNATSVSVERGVLTFFYKPSATSGGKKIVTTVPFLIETDTAG
jgi:hypothetical protein